jgi:hypothetical protein
MVRLLVLCSLCFSGSGAAFSQGRDVDRADTRSLINEGRAENRAQRNQDQKRQNEMLGIPTPSGAIRHVPAATR